jgi:mono/diheme cytochrome c family protein
MMTRVESDAMRLLPIVILSTVLFSAHSPAQETGDARKGADYARAHCAECHGWKPSDTTSPVAKAPNFASVANSSGMTGTALIVWFRTPHQSMPTLVIAPADQLNLAEYILSLREKR